MFRGYIRKGSLVLGIGLCSFFLYRLLPSFLVSRFLPSVFGFLVSSSPIIICTALLLGTLLSFGQTSSPGVKEKDNRTPVKSLRTRNVADELADKKTARVKEKATKEARLGKEIEDISISKRAIVQDSEKKIRRQRKVEKREFFEDTQSHSSDDCKEIEGQKSSVHNDSDSYKENSSPDASMIDVIPMLDELHPLIETEALIPTHTPQDGSDGHDSDTGSVDLAADVENPEEEEAQEKSVVTWTEDDTKSLKDLGTLELERNLRLENLIAKRRARKRWMFEAERNLIDFDSTNDGMQINVPIRRNPFDAPYDLDEILGLSPIPGSAPSATLPRFNLFNLPDERGNVVGENLIQQEYAMPQQRDTFFRRYESFTSGASFLGEMKQEKHEFKFRPYFVPEGTAYDTTFPKELSERSNSKVSSIPESDTTSTFSIADQEDDNKELVEQELPLTGESSCFHDYASERVGRESELSEEVDIVEIDSNSYDASEDLPQDAHPFNGGNVEREGGEENDQVDDPLYDSSPSAISVSLSNETASSEDSSDPHPVTVDRGILHSDKESMLNNGNEREDMRSNDGESWVEPPKLSSEDKFESRSRGDEEVSEHNVIQVRARLEPVGGEASEEVTLSLPAAKSMHDDKVNHQSREAQVSSSPQSDMVEKADAEENHKQSQDMASLQN